MKTVIARATPGQKAMGLGDLEIWVDDEDYEEVSKYQWKRTGLYAHTSVSPRQFPGHSHLFMHRLIMKAEPGQLVDHIDGNRLNNSKSNLRLCSLSENSHNRARRDQLRTKKNGAVVPYTSRYKGVSGREGAWSAKISANHKAYHLGTFRTEEDAARAYDDAARRLHGEFARLNFPEGRNDS